jgi:hypothetical protein
VPYATVILFQANNSGTRQVEEIKHEQVQKLEVKENIAVVQPVLHTNVEGAALAATHFPFSFDPYVLDS